MRGVGPIEAILCDADGNLFPSEEPAFEASVPVVNRFMCAVGCEERFSADELRRATTGKNFRTTISDLCAERGLPLGPQTLEAWVAEERRCVTAHLARCLLPNPWVREVLCELEADHRLAAVSSSASARLDACFEATGLADLFPPLLRFSAEDSLAMPTSKPDPAIYLHAAAQLGLDPERCLAIEDSVPGARSAVAAGCPLIGNVVFVPPAERDVRARELAAAGARAVIGSWSELGEIVRSGAADEELVVGA